MEKQTTKLGAWELLDESWSVAPHLQDGCTQGFGFPLHLWEPDTPPTYPRHHAALPAFCVVPQVPYSSWRSKDRKTCCVPNELQD